MNSFAVSYWAVNQVATTIRAIPRIEAVLRELRTEREIGTQVHGLQQQIRQGSNIDQHVHGTHRINPICGIRFADITTAAPRSLLGIPGKPGIQVLGDHPQRVLGLVEVYRLEN